MLIFDRGTLLLEACWFFWPIPMGMLCFLYKDKYIRTFLGATGHFLNITKQINSLTTEESSKQQ